MATHRGFQPKSIRGILEATKKGITVNVVVKINAKSMTDDRSLLSSTRPFTLEVDLIRAYIVETGVDVQPPVRVKAAKPKREAAAIKADKASDDLLKKLAELGI